MTLFELFIQSGAITEEQRQQIIERLIPEIVRAEGAPSDLIERGQANTCLVIHDLDALVIGGDEITANDPPRFVVRVSLPAGHMHEAMTAEMMARITRVLSDVIGDPDRLYEELDAWIHVVEVPDGQMGAFGQIVSTAEIMRMVVNGQRPESRRAQPGPDTETVNDPICGMTVDLADSHISLVVDGTTYGFCSTSCREIFAEQQGVPVR